MAESSYARGRRDYHRARREETARRIEQLRSVARAYQRGESPDPEYLIGRAKAAYVEGRIGVDEMERRIDRALEARS